MKKSYYVGAILWLLSLQYYAAQAITAYAWSASNSYSWAHNTISDLGNTYCGTYGDRLVCSPLYMLMNISFLLLGATMIGGSLLLWTYLGINRFAKLGLVFMAIAGAGTVLVGLFPENTVGVLHITGAALPFVLGNLGMIMLGMSCGKLPLLLRVFSIFTGVTGLIALVLFLAQTYLGLGAGGMERFAAYPQSVWMIVVGAYLISRQRL